MSERKSNPLSDFLRERADVVIPDQDHAGGLHAGEVLAWRHWFASRQRLLRSSGGRPTNPAWTLKRQIPFSPETWEKLEKQAEVCSADEKRIGPGQIAGFLIEDVLLRPAPVLAEEGCRVNDKLSEPTHDPQFDEWKMPGIFAGAATE